MLVNVLDFDFNSTKPPGQDVVNRGKNHEEGEAENAGKDRPENINSPDDSEFVPAEDDHRDADERVEAAHEDIESGHYLAGL